MTKQKILIAGGGFAILMVVLGWILLARYLIGGGDTSSLQNNVIIDTQEDKEDALPTQPNQQQPITPDTQDPQGDIQKDELKQSDLKDEVYIGDLYIALPHRVDQQALQDLTDLINTDSSTITLHITQATSLEQYSNMLADPVQMDRFDLVLLPSSRYDSYHTQTLKLPFQQNIISGFHPSLSEIILESEFSFLPYAIDPIVTYADQDIADDAFGRDDIASYLLNQPDPDQIPLGLGVSPVDTKLLSAQRHPLASYQYTLSQIIASSIATSDHTLLAQLIGADLRDFRSIFKTTDAQQDPLCDIDAALCLHMTDQLQVGFGSLSSLLHAHKTTTSITKKQKNISSLPDISSLTADARGWVAPITATHRESILARLLGYLQQAPSSNLPLRDTSISALSEVSHLQLLQTQYKHLTPYIQSNNLTILQSKKTHYQDLQKNTPLQKVLEGDYSARLYIDEYGAQ